MRFGVVIFAGLIASNFILLPYIYLAQNVFNRLVNMFNGGLLIVSMITVSVVTFFVYILVYGFVYGFIFNRFYESFPGFEQE